MKTKIIIIKKKKKKKKNKSSLTRTEDKLKYQLSEINIVLLD